MVQDKLLWVIYTLGHKHACTSMSMGLSSAAKDFMASSIGRYPLGDLKQIDHHCQS